QALRAEDTSPNAVATLARTSDGGIRTGVAQVGVDSIRAIVEFGGGAESFLFLAPVCKGWLDAYASGAKKEAKYTSTYTSTLAIVMSSTRLAWATSAGWKGDENVCKLAAATGKLDVFEGCRKLGCRGGSGVLSAAVRGRNTDIVQAVLDNPDCPVEKDALELAIASGSVEMTQLVGSKYEFPKDDWKRTAVVDGLFKAASDGSLAMVQCLWEWVPGHEDTEVLRDAIEKSARNGHFAVAERLVKTYLDYFDPDEDTNEVILTHFPSSHPLAKKIVVDEAEYRASLGLDEDMDYDLDY
ncbi:unnamed protein product, partial [Ectocarpus sp. 12 AP-2014]